VSIQFGHIFITADMLIIDKYLRHGVLSATVDHFTSFGGIHCDIDLGEVDAFFSQ